MDIKIYKKAGIKILVFNTCSFIPSEELTKIFEELYKVDKSRNPEKPSHGLGLSIVKAVVKLHYGNIEVKNIKNSLEFKIKLLNKVKDSRELC